MGSILTYTHKNDRIPRLSRRKADSGVNRLQDVNFGCGTNIRYTKDVLWEPMDYVFDSIDLREAGLSTTAKNQGNCGACWAFSTAAVLENLILRS